MQLRLHRAFSLEITMKKIECYEIRLRAEAAHHGWDGYFTMQPTLDDIQAAIRIDLAETVDEEVETDDQENLERLYDRAKAFGLALDIASFLPEGFTSRRGWFDLNVAGTKVGSCLVEPFSVYVAGQPGE